MLFNSSHPQGQDVSPSPPAESPEIADLGGRLTYQPEPVQPCSGYPSTFGHELNDFAKAVLEGSSPAVPVASSLLVIEQPPKISGENVNGALQFGSPRFGAKRPRPHGQTLLATQATVLNL